jgi:hypothetical protein
MASAFESMMSYHQELPKYEMPLPILLADSASGLRTSVATLERAISWPVILTLLCHVQVFVMTLVMDPSHTVIQPHSFCSSPLCELSTVP